MKRHIIHFLFPALLFSVIANAQISSYDGVIVKSLEVNRDIYYFGEPFRIYFLTINSTNETKSFYGLSYLYKLKNITTGETLEPNARSIGEGPYWRKPPYIKPNMIYYSSMKVGEDFGKIRLIDKPVKGYSVVLSNLQALPVGKYELTLEYHFGPLDLVLYATHKFEVVKAPAEEQKIIDQFLKTTYYANEHNFYGRRQNEYDPQHPDSYENFIKKYPNSIFSEYAVLDMTWAVYSYPGPSEEEMIKKWKEYIAFYTKIKNPDVALYYLDKLPIHIEHIAFKTKTDAKQISDDFLRTKLNHSYLQSDYFINKSNVVIKGLKNYAIKEK